VSDLLQFNIQFVEVCYSFKRIFRLFSVLPGGAEADWVTWQLEWSFNGQLCQEYSHQKLS